MGALKMGRDEVQRLVDGARRHLWAVSFDFIVSCCWRWMWSGVGIVIADVKFVLGQES